MSPESFVGRFICGPVTAAMMLVGSASAQEKRLLENSVAIVRKDTAKAIPVKHLGTNTQGWEVGETENFVIFLKDVPQSMLDVGSVIEETRKSVAEKWFGEAKEKWNPKCEVSVYPNGDEYARWTGNPRDNPGHTKTELERGKVVRREIHVQYRPGAADVLKNLLPHEVTHAVCADEFFGRFPPRWKDEGVATLSETSEKVQEFSARFRLLCEKGESYTLRQVFEATDYPGRDPKSLNAFYSQSIVVADFLARKKSPRVLQAFTQDAYLEGYDKALEKHYGYKSVEALAEDISKFVSKK